MDVPLSSSVSNFCELFCMYEQNLCSIKLSDINILLLLYLKINSVKQYCVVVGLKEQRKD